MSYTYTPSQLVAGNTELLRDQGFTRWISPDLFQAAAEFMRNIGLLPLYVECAADKKRRCLSWHPPEGCYFEVRSGRTLEQFAAIDLRNVERNWPLLSLHVNESGIHSAVWVSADHYEIAKAVLARHGITPASRELPA